MFYPNVRGSTGYGKRFVGLDNGPFKREDSVKDIGAFLTRLKADPGLDAGRFAQTGRSYGGYMCYATAIMFPTDFRSANCVVPISDFVDLPQQHAELSPRLAPRRIWRRARSQAARAVQEDRADAADHRNPGPALCRRGRERPARARVGSAPGGRGAQGSRDTRCGCRSPRTKATSGARRKMSTTSSGPTSCSGRKPCCARHEKAAEHRCPAASSPPLESSVRRPLRRRRCRFRPRAARSRGPTRSRYNCRRRRPGSVSCAACR